MLTTDLQEHWNNGFFGGFFFLKCFNNPHQKLDSVNLMGLIVCVGQPFGIYAYALSGEELDVKIGIHTANSDSSGFTQGSS